MSQTVDPPGESVDSVIDLHHRVVEFEDVVGFRPNDLLFVVRRENGAFTESRSRLSAGDPDSPTPLVPLLA